MATFFVGKFYLVRSRRDSLDPDPLPKLIFFFFFLNSL